MACVSADLLGSIGLNAKPAIPALLEQLPVYGYPFSNAVASALWKIGRQTNFALGILTSELRPIPNLKMDYPLRSLREMGPGAKPAAPLLLPLLRDSDEGIRIAASDALREIDPVLYNSACDAMNAGLATNLLVLIQMLHGSAAQRSAALGALVVYGPDAKPALPAIIQILQNAASSGSEGEVEDAVRVIAEIGPEAQEAVPALRGLLTGSGWDYTPFLVGRALANIGPAASVAVPVLKRALPPVRRQFRDLPWSQVGAATALARITPQAKTSLVPILTKLANFSVPNSEERFPEIELPAKVALWRLGMAKDPPIRELMLPTVTWPYHDVVPLLGDIGSPAKSAVPYLIHIVDSDHYYGICMRRAAAIAIRKIDPHEAANLHLPGILALP
jgi:HEAT repeat protein